jgi:hypothetical protein
MACALAAALPLLYPEVPARALAAGRGLLIVAGLTLVVGTTWERDDVGAIAALEQIGVLGIGAYGVLGLGRVRTFNALTGLIALRVLVAYFEVFGSLLGTGLGMITGGALTLLLAWVWKNKSPELAARLADAGDGGADAA